MKKNGEEHQQIQLMNWLHRNYPHVWKCTHHSPNGGKRHKVTAMNFKLMGVKKGFPDLVSYYASGVYCGLAIELKDEFGFLTTEQDEWLDILKRCGFETRVCWGLEEGKDAFRHYLELQ